MNSPVIAKDAAAIPNVTPAETYRLNRDELDCFLAVLATLAPDDWDRPTDCALWTVRDIVAHQAGGYASGTGYREMFKQYLRLPENGYLLEDAINAYQLNQRAGRSPRELVAELEANGDPAIRNWAYGFRPLKPLGVPRPDVGWLTMRDLMLLVHSRDTWIHRLDICRATGRPFEQTPQHDGRINELVVRDVARLLRKKLGKRAVNLTLTGPAGGSWKLGGAEPSAAIEMDTLDFNIYVSGRRGYEEARFQAQVSGDAPLAELAMRDFRALY